LEDDLMEKSQVEKPRLLVVPFGDRYFPKPVIDMVVSWSVDMLNALDMDLVIAPTVMNIADAATAARLAEASATDGTILLIASWLEAANLLAAVKPVLHRPILLWSHTSYEVPGEKQRAMLGAFVGAAVIRETLEEMDVNFKWIWGMPQEPKIGRQIAVFGRAAHAAARLSAATSGCSGTPRRDVRSTFVVSPAPATRGASLDHILLKGMKK
jgi:hypothetical protein